MEYIEFSQNVIIKDILSIIKLLGMNYKFFEDESIQLKGISNGLYKIDSTVCFVENIKNIEQLETMNNALILTNSDYISEFDNFNIVYLDDCRYVFIQLLEYFQKNSYLKPFTTFINHTKPYISNNAKIHPSAIIEENVVIEDDVSVAAGCVIKNGTFIGKHTIIRENCTIGCDGIALYKAKNEEVMRFPHIAGTYISNDVEIGANCVVVKGTLSNTKIMDHTVIGNLSNIGHGVKIGSKVWMSVGTLIGGNSRIEDNVTIGLGVSTKDNILIAENSTVGMGSVVTKSIVKEATVFGNPAKPIRPLNVGPKR